MVPRISRSVGNVRAYIWFALASYLALGSGFAAADAGRQPRVPSVLFTAQSADALPEVGARAAVDPTRPALTPEEKRFRTNAIIIGGAVSVAAYGATTWWNEGFGGFKTVREGWFGQGTPDGGADKLGHMQANYVGTRLLTRAFEWAGLDSSESLTLAAISTFSVFAGAEVLDAFTPRYRFSYEDVVMNAVGVGVAMLMEKNPRLDALVDLRLQYKPSADPRTRGGFDPFGDYSGQTYLLVGKASGVPALRELPAVRYLELAVGYGTRGYEVGPDVIGDKSRYVYAGVSLNLSELLDRTVFRGEYRDSLSHRATRGFLEVFQIPGTAALARNKL